jgi:hypothetical protein
VCVFAFDCLFVDGESLIKRPLVERRERLAAALPNLLPGHVALAHSHVLLAPKAPDPQPAPRQPCDTAQQAASAPDSVAPVAGAKAPAGANVDHTDSTVTAMQPMQQQPAEQDGVVRSDTEALPPGCSAVSSAGAAEQTEAGLEALIREHLQDALAAGTEGLMLKALTGPAAAYQPSKRSNSWLKIKRCVTPLSQCTGVPCSSLIP